MKDHVTRAQRGYPRPRRFDFSLVAQTVEHHIVSRGSETLGDTQADAAGGAGNDHGFHVKVLL